ncbi:AIM24 family protein [Deinococcus sp.]|uniref:AIM24 family protein n=1 Tax=Deinococcus sp. TaxID=47478 RepID=UPI002869BD57|nr:AIM24 family protein [Deinococcus sp.]
MIPDLPTPPEEDGTARSGLRYRIIGKVQPTVLLDLDARHGVFTDAGGLSWMTPTISMTTNMQGGLLGGLSRAFSGGTVFLIHLNTTSRGQAAFCADFPGKIVPLELDAGESIITHKQAFLCAESTVELAVTFTRRLGAGLVGGDGFVLQKLTGPGLAFVEMDGDAIEYRLNPGETMLVEPGHVAMFDPSVEFSIEMMKGIRNLLFSGESLFFAKLTGPGRVWLNSMTVSKVAHRVGEYLPGKS